MSAREFLYWQIFATLEPIGAERGDVQAAIIAQTIANRHRSPEHENPYKLSDFMLDYTPREPVPPPPPQDHRAFFRELTKAWGGRIITKEEQQAAL